MRYLLLILLPIVLLSTPFKVATYNVENLFDAQAQGTEYKEYISGKHNWNRRMMEIKLNHTAEVICDVDADILGLQEIENANILKQLQARLKRVGCAYKYAAITHKKNAPIQVALLSRYPITHTKEIVVRYSPLVRNILQAQVTVANHTLTLFVNHWKSKSYHGYESKRIAYAKALKDAVMQLPTSKAYILLGDFNSDYDAYKTIEEKNNDTAGKTGFSDVLHTRTKENAMPKAKRGIHYTLWHELPLHARWSQKFYGKHSTPDQIVLPQSMFDGKGIDYVNNSFKVFKKKYLFTKRGYINRWRYKHGKHMAKGYSDHLPVFALFDTKAYVADKHKHGETEQKIVPIAYLYSRENLNQEVILKNILVLMKRGRHAVVKQSPKGRGVMLYGCAATLKEGHRYDLVVEGIKSYHGLKEVIGVRILKHRGETKRQPYYGRLDTHTQQNEVITEMTGIYKNRMLFVDNKKIPIYFKNRKHTPPNGSKLKIHYAHLGYYNHLQLVIYRKKDFEIVEK